MKLAQPFVVKRYDLWKPSVAPQTLQFNNSKRKELVDFLSLVVAKRWSDDWRPTWKSGTADNGNFTLTSGNVCYEVAVIITTDDGLVTKSV